LSDDVNRERRSVKIEAKTGTSPGMKRKASTKGEEDPEESPSSS
jgi:hypothetical protein